MTSPAADSPLVIKGWSIFAHPQFLDTFDSLVAQVERLRAKDPKGYTAKNSTKRLAAIVKLAFEIIPEDPTRSEERREGKSVDLGGRRIIKKKKKKHAGVNTAVSTKEKMRQQD